MVRQHSSVLLRCWDLGSDGERIEIEHIQTGTKVLVRSVAAAGEWIGAQGGDPATRQRPGPDPAVLPSGEGSRGGGDG
ncbi:hypothetical protein BH23CHL2_BH23CHL2_22140 [soil metagenome]